jgi:SAM-dependent MidA family methyltransferase
MSLLNDVYFTFKQAFKNHQLSHPLLEPGNSDLTSNLDFLHLAKVFSENGGS